MSFMDELDEAFKEGEINKKIREKNPKKVNIHKVSLKDKIKGAKGAWKRYKEKGITNKETYCSEQEAIERQVCCTTCTDGGSCPYCGCNIKKSWFLPLGKSDLTTEGCPNPNTYPHLSKFPPKNFWELCEETTSIIIASRNEKYLNKTIENLLETSTGKIEILVGLDGYDYDVIKSDKIKVIKEEKPIGRRKISNKLVKLATGKFLFEIDAHCIMDLGWDTKLKCVCDEGNIISCVIDSINEEKWQTDGNKWLGCYIDENFNWGWLNFKPQEDWEKVEETLSFFSAVWMIQKDTFLNFNGHKEYLGQHVNEDIEWTCNILGTGGHISIRTDVKCAHLFRNEFPYKNNDNYLVSKNLLKKIWDGSNEGQNKNIEDIIKDFRQKYEK